MIDSYISDMTDYIAPENETAMMRVDRNDIWWNYKQIEGEATSFDWIVQDTGSTPATYKRLFIPNPFSSDEENEAKKSAQQQEEDAIEGELRLVGEYEAGLTWRIDKNKMWESYFDRESGWYCIGNPILENGDTAVIIIDNMIAVVDNTSELKAVWAQPMFI